MTDKIMKELWDIKDNIAKEYSYDIDKLAEYYLKKQLERQSVKHRHPNCQENGQNLSRTGINR
ncbi:hypothetical protein TI05_11265 [Achromatium sp. WMS3]|nr:hypothetical protein TI05_11265 [Achromatium sp. WMS3]